MPKPVPADAHAAVLFEEALKRLAWAFVLGSLVAGIYRLAQGRSRNGSPGLAATLILLTILITMLSLVIGDRQAQAFALVGALSIIRFRTVVEDTRDSAFVICAVAVGMTIGVAQPLVALVGLPFIAIVAVVFRPLSAQAATATGAAVERHTLKLRVGLGSAVDELVRPVFGKHLAESMLLGTATVRQGSALELTYDVRLLRPAEAAAFVAELNGLERVQEVELRRV